MTDCSNGDVRDRLPDLLHDRLTADGRREVEAHLSGCDECRAELALLGAMRFTLRRAPAVDPAAIAAAIPPYRAPVRRGWGGWRAAAAVLLLAGGTSVAVLRSRDDTRSAVGAGDHAVVARRAESVVPVAGVAPADTPAAPAAARELALGTSVASDLDDRELSTLLSDLQSLDIVPSAEVENGAPVSPLQPPGTN